VRDEDVSGRVSSTIVEIGVRVLQVKPLIYISIALL
jgi:hypothetical protein